MQKQQKMIALVGILAIVASITVVSTLDQVQAVQSEPTSAEITKVIEPKRYGSATDVCGDRLCSEAVSKIDIEHDTPIGTLDSEDSNAPYATLISIHKYTSAPFAGDIGISYRVTYKVTAGDTNLRDIQIHGQSDIDTIDTSISSLNAFSSTVQVIRIHAIEAESISGKIVSYSLTGPTGGPPR